jgi:hypothetical protein
MNRIPTIGPATGKARQLLDAVPSKLGITPSISRVLAQAPSALVGCPGFSATVAHAALNPFTNQLNHVAENAIDFPEVKAGATCDEAACACA